LGISKEPSTEKKKKRARGSFLRQKDGTKCHQKNRNTRVIRAAAGGGSDLVEEKDRGGGEKKRKRGNGGVF